MGEAFVVRNLTPDNLKQAIQLKIACWPEQLAGVAENDLSLAKEYAFWLDWMNTAEEHNDMRMLIGIFHEEKLAGAAFASFAEEHDCAQGGIELNGLWVDEGYRGRGLSVFLLRHIVDCYQKKGKEKLVVYCHHYAPSNKFYRKLGGKVLRQDRQMAGALLVDIFEFDLKLLSASLGLLT